MNEIFVCAYALGAVRLCQCRPLHRCVGVGRVLATAAGEFHLTYRDAGRAKVQILFPEVGPGMPDFYEAAGFCVFFGLPQLHLSKLTFSTHCFLLYAETCTQ